MTTKNYFNGVPTSIVQYGFGRQQLQTYDGVISGSTAAEKYEITLNTLEQQLTDLENQLSAIESSLGGVTVTDGIITADTASLTTLTTVTSNVTSDNVAGQLVTSSAVMNSRPIYLRSGDDPKTIIQGDNGGGLTPPAPEQGFLEVRGEKGGALCDWYTGSRRICMEWGGSRIRSPLSFQAGYDNTNAHQVTVSFPTTFLYTPSVVCNIIYSGASEHQFYARITSITTGGFIVKKYYIDGGDYTIKEAGSEGFHWIAFDPTDTSIF